MSMLKKLRIVALAGVVGFIGLEVANTIEGSPVFSVVSTAEAIIGRPLTPISVAGVARRTVRRCAVGVYYC